MSDRNWRNELWTIIKNTHPDKIFTEQQLRQELGLSNRTALQKVIKSNVFEVVKPTKPALYRFNKEAFIHWDQAKFLNELERFRPPVVKEVAKTKEIPFTKANIQLAYNQIAKWGQLFGDKEFNELEFKATVAALKWVANGIEGMLNDPRAAHIDTQFALFEENEE